MKKFFYLILFTVTSLVNAADIQIIELNNKSIDQLILEDKAKKIKQESNLLNDDIDNWNVLQDENISDQDNLQDPSGNVESFSENQITELLGLWENVNKEEIIFLLDNISQIQSKKLKKELLDMLNINQKLPDNFSKDDFNKLMIDTLLMLGDRKKAYEIIKSMQIDLDNKYEIFYKKFLINYLLSSYQLSEACSLRNLIENANNKLNSNFYLKIDIFCLILKEKFDEANLLNSLLIESGEIDDYFQSLYEIIKNSDNEVTIDSKNINEKNIFLYSAMHRIGNLPLTSKFLEIDPMNLSMPIILSSSTDISLRIKSAHYAFLNNLISEDSLAALYQTVDFSYEDLNNPSKFIDSIEGKVEIGMAYFYQLINIQLLPKTRLNSIIKFWEFAKKNDYEEIAFTLSLKNLDSIEPSNDLVNYGPNIAKAYIYNQDYEKAEKWILFSENLLMNDIDIENLNTTKLLLNLSNVKDGFKFNEVLLSNFEDIKQNKLNNNELFYLIFMSLGEFEKNDFELFRKINDKRSMPSLYILDMIRDSVKNDNQIQLLLSILVGMDGKSWNELHPEHFRLILMSLKEYKNGSIYNDILFEILNLNNII